MEYSYFLYGMCLKSRAVIDGLSAEVSPHTAPRGADCVHIDIGEFPAWLLAAAARCSELIYPLAPHAENAALQVFSFDRRAFFQLIYEDGMRFVVSADTRHVWAARPPDLPPEDLGIYLLGPVMGFLLRQRGVLSLHASSFSLADHAFALCGGPGAGKSTTAAAFALRGASVLSEDITALRENHGRFQVAPGYPRVNLWPDSAQELFGCVESLPKITPNWEKRYLSLDGKRANFETHERPLAAVYILEARSNATNAPRIEELSAREAVLLLVQNTYMNYLLDKSQRAAEFSALTQLVASTPVKRVVPSGDPRKLGTLCELLEADAAMVSGLVKPSPSGPPR